MLTFLLHRGRDEKLMFSVIPDRWPSLISVSYQRVCTQSHQNFVLFPGWKLQVSSIHFPVSGEGKDTSSNITSGGTKKLRYQMLESAQYGTVPFSQKVPEITCLERECCQATKLCCPNTILKDKYNCIICVRHQQLWE